MMKLNKLNREFGKDARNHLEFAHQKSLDGAVACLESFYYSFNHQDLDTFKKIWYDHELIQLNNPLGGMIRGIQPIVALYDQIFHGQARVWVTFTDILYYATEEMVVFTGTEMGEYSTQGEIIPLKIRTSRVFAYIDPEKRWFQVHHHGSIDDAALLYQYQNAVRK